MEEILHQVVDSLSMFIPLFTGFYTSQAVVWDFFYQQYETNVKGSGGVPGTPPVFLARKI